MTAMEPIDTMVDEGNTGIHEGSTGKSTGSSTGKSAGNSEDRPGELLRKKRESLDFTVAYVAEHLRLTEEYIHSLENDDFNQLPSEPFVLGYYRAYARILGLSADEVIGLYRDVISGHTQGTPEGLVADKPARQQSEKRRPQTRERNEFGQAKTPKSSGLGNRIYLIVTLALISIWVVVSLLSEKQANEAPRGAPSATLEVPSRETAAPSSPETTEPEATKTEAAMVVEPTVEDSSTAGEAAGDLQSQEVEASEGLSEASAAAKSVTALAPAAVDAEAIVEAEAEASPMNTVQAESWQQPQSSESVIDTESQTAEKAEFLPANNNNQPAQVAQSQGAFDTLAFSFAEDCWLEVKDVTGDVLTAKVYNAGDTVELKGTGPFKLMLGNVRAAQLSLNGVQVALTPNGSRKTLRTTVGVDTPVSE